jgi:hypothetical protein
MNVADILVGTKSDLATPEQALAFDHFAHEMYPAKVVQGWRWWEFCLD